MTKVVMMAKAPIASLVNLLIIKILRLYYLLAIKQNKSENKPMKKEGKNKPHFRSAARRAGFEYLERQLQLAQRKLRDNKYEISKLTKEQTILKSDISGLHQLIQEFLK